MNKEEELSVIAALSEAKGAPGFEEEVVSVIQPLVRGLGESWTDSMQNFYVKRKENKGGRLMIQLDAHTDEVGFMVQAVRPDGMLEIVPLGGWVASNIPAEKVLVRNVHGAYIPGITGSKPPHFMTEKEREEPLTIKNITVDIGADSDQDAFGHYGIRVGAPVVPDVSFDYWEDSGLLIGKAFDCRLGCAAMIRVLKELKGKELGIDVTAAFSVQEEVGMRGAVVTANTVRPDMAIVFEGCPADDNCVQEPYRVQSALKRGPMLRYLDQGMITHPGFQKAALDTAEECQIPVQTAVRELGATNGKSIHLSGRGTPTIVIGIPVRYAHTHYGISAYADYDNAVKLAIQILLRIERQRY